VYIQPRSLVDLQLPAMMYHGTSTINLPSIKRGELNPLGTYSGQITLTSDLSDAIQMAMTQAFWDTQALGCDRLVSAVTPIVCQVDTRGLSPQYFTIPNLVTGRVGYTQPIRLNQDAIITVAAGA